MGGRGELLIWFTSDSSRVNHQIRYLILETFVNEERITTSTTYVKQASKVPLLYIIPSERGAWRLPQALLSDRSYELT